LEIAWRRRAILILVTAGVVAMAIAADFLLPSTYSSSAVLMLEPRRNTVTGQSAVLSDTPTDPASVQNQVAVLTSRELALRVMADEGLFDDPEFAAVAPPLWGAVAVPANSRRLRDSAVTAFLKHLTVQAVGLSTSFTVTFTSHDPEKAARISDAIVAAYIRSQSGIDSDAAARTTDWLMGRIAQLGQQVQAAEAAVQRYKAENNLNDTADGSSLTDAQLEAVSTQLLAARADFAAKQAQSQHVKALVEAGHGADVAQIVSSPLIVQLRAEQAAAVRDDALLATRYGPRDPKRIAAQSQKRDFDAKIAEEVSRIAGSLENDVDVARAQLATLETELVRAERRSSADNTARIKLKALEANAQSTRSIYEAFVTRLRETQGQDGAPAASARVISHAPIPTAPSSPPRLLIALAALPGGFLLGLLVALLVERLSQVGANIPAGYPRPRSSPVPVSAAMPDVSTTAPRFAATRPVSGNEALRDTVRNLISPERRGVPKVIVITGIDLHAGADAVALGLARAAAGLGLRTILVEGTAGPGRLADVAGRPRHRAGFAEVLAGRSGLEEAVLRDSHSDVLLLPLASVPRAMADLWRSARLPRFLRHLRETADIVIILCAPLSRPQEWAVAARHADSVLVVVPAHQRERAGGALRNASSIAPCAELLVAG
jgi:uncharacterized protein involved in exopolysaccharide biosynthesis/Mrp family chromosome partitioning ATPase